MKPDEAHIETDKKIAELEKRMRREYRQAAEEVAEKLADYFRRFEKKDEIKRAQLAAGEITKADYDGWRTGQMLAGERWKEMRDTLAAELNAVNMNARRIVNGERAEVYAENHNYATYEIEKAAKVDTSYTLYDRSTVERIVAEQPDILPAPGKQMKGKLARGEAVRWQAGQIQSVTLQSILQGESIPNMAKRIGKTLGEKNYGTAVRYARTAMTGAQSAGRQDSYKRAEDMGINLKRRWVATLDMRTRHEHRMLDMQVRGIDEPFDAEGEEIMFPGDPNAPAHLIWNCRCRTIAEVEGLEHNWDRRSMDDLGGMTYEEWKKAHGKSQPITAQTEKGEAARRAAIAEYRNAKLQAEKQNVSIYDEIGDYPKRPKRADYDDEDALMRARTEYKEQREKVTKQVAEWFEKNYGNIDISDDELYAWAERNNIIISGSLDGLDRRALKAYTERYETLAKDFPQVNDYHKKLETPFEIAYRPDRAYDAEASFGMTFGHPMSDYKDCVIGQYSDSTTGGTVRGINPALRTFDHEFGHQLWTAMREEGIELTTEQLRAKISMEDDFVQSVYRKDGMSEYATINTHELFAEAFAAWYGGEETEFANAMGDFLKRYGVIK